MAQQSSAGILMAIHATYAEQILSGRKTIEFRRQKPRIPEGTRIWLYATKGSLRAKTGAVVGSFAADGIVEVNALAPTQRTLRAGAVTRKLFGTYFDRVDVGWGIKVTDPVRLLKPVPTNQLGLQSYRWLQPRGKDRTLYYGHLRNGAPAPRETDLPTKTDLRPHGSGTFPRSGRSVLAGRAQLEESAPHTSARALWHRRTRNLRSDP